MIHPVYIYGLRETGTSEIRYVGKTVNPEVRFLDHKYCSFIIHKNHCQEWIASVIQTGGSIEMVTLEVCSPDRWKEREYFWANHYQDQGHRITNMSGVKNRFYPKRRWDQGEKRYVSRQSDDQK